MKDLTDQRFGKLVVISIGSRNPNRRGTHWLCQCDCGGTLETRSDALTSGRAKSCGCSHKRHGHSSNGQFSSEYKSWSAMIARCHVSTNGAYKQYGAKGIAVCSRWRIFENFLADMGQKPTPDHSIERKDNQKGYLPENCRWATRKEQGKNKTNNRILTIDGVSKPQTQWAEEAHIPISRLKTRLAMGWTTKEAVFSPIRKRQTD